MSIIESLSEPVDVCSLEVLDGCRIDNHTISPFLYWGFGFGLKVSCMILALHLTALYMVTFSK